MKSFSRMSAASTYRAARAFQRSRLAPISMQLRRTMAMRAQAVTYSECGNPARVLTVEDVEINDKLADKQILVKVLAAPITPSDITQVEGWDGATTGTAKRVAGNEAVAEVVKVGSKVKSVKSGDWVVPAKSQTGTWCTHAVANEEDYCKIEKFSKTKDIEHAATGIVAPAVATRLLEDFVKLDAGDVIIQNGAASGVAQVVMQLAAERGIIVINIAREHNDWDTLVNHFHGLNNTCISVTEEYTRTPEFKRLLSDIPKPKLGIDMVGGRAGLAVAQTLADQGTLVSIGNVSKHPLPLTADVLLQKGINVTGFKLDKWLSSKSREDRDGFIQQMAALSDQGKTKQLLAWEPFKDFQIALERAQQRGERKVVLVMDPSKERMA